MQHKPVIIKGAYRAPLQKVWTALTSADALRCWFFDTPNFEAKTGFEFAFWGKGEDGADWLHKCVVKDAELYKKLSFSWHYEGYNGIALVAYELYEENNETHITVTHSGLETFPEIRAFEKENFEKGWTALIGSLLKNYVERED